MTASRRRRSETIRPIHDEADLSAALTEIEKLMVEALPGSPDEARLEVLSTLVEAYEARRYPMLPPDPVAAIRFRLEQQGLTAKALEGVIGTRARVSEILNRRRPLTLAMIRRLHHSFGIPLESLVGDEA